MKIRTATYADLPRIVEIHQQAFPNHFMTSLGGRFLQQYYHSILDYPESIALIAELEMPSLHHPIPKPLAFCVGFVDSPGFYQQLRQRRGRLAFSVLKQLLRQPKLLSALTKRYRTTQQRSKAADTSNAAAVAALHQQLPQHLVAELSSVGCANAARGKGVGAELVREFLARAETANAALCSLTTDRDQNDSVRSFYRHLGFAEAGVETAQQGRPMIRYNYHYQQVAAA